MDKLALYRRSAKDLWRVGKKYYCNLFLSESLKQGLSFISLYFMAKFVDLLVAGQYSALKTYIIYYIVIIGACHLLNAFLEPYVEFQKVMTFRTIGNLPYDKILDMHYHYADSSETAEQLEAIRIGNFSRQSSLAIQNVRLPYLISQVVRAIGSALLIIPVFKFLQVIPGRWAFFSSIYSLLIILVFIGVGVYIELNSGKKVTQVLARDGAYIQELNAIYNHEMTIYQDPEGLKDAKLYNLIPKLLDTLKLSMNSSIQLVGRLQSTGRNYRILGTLMSQGMTYYLYLALAVQVLLGSLPLGLVVQLSSALNTFIMSIVAIVQQFGVTLSDPAALEQYYQYMDLPDEQEIGSIPVEKRLDNNYQLSVEDMSFKYPNAQEYTLKDINANFEVGKKYAIVGENGSGKTTFIKVLMRLYEPSKGKVSLNRIDAAKYKLTEYFDLFSVVFQDFRLLSMKIGQNIAVAQDYDTEKALKTVEEVGLKDFVDTLPDGIDNYLGSEFDASGVKMSGGQAQKLALARALYKDAPIMILDEPTAALDPIAEFEIYQHFDELAKDRTAFYISHRLSSCRFCDEILVFDQGEIVQRGSHEELLKQAGKYQDLWQAQAQYYQ